MINADLSKEMQGYNLDAIADEIKKKDFFSIYEKSIELLADGKTDSQLSAFTLIEGMTDKKLSLMVQKVSADILFKMLDLKFRNEILSKPEGENASV